MVNSFILKRRNSFSNAFRGIAVILKSQVNFRIHLAVLVLVILAGVFFRITSSDWMVVILAGGLVLTAEGLNTALEFICNAVTMEENPHLRMAKDAAAGGVLMAAIAAAAAGLIVFIPHFLSLLR